MIKKDKKLVLVFIGSLKHHVDCIAPCVGKLIEKRNKSQCIVLYCDQTQIAETKTKLKEYPKEEYQILALDVGFLEGSRKFLVQNKGLTPSKLIKPTQRTVIGDMGIIINISGIYSGSLKNQKKKLLRNENSPKIHKRVNKIIKDTYIEVDKLLKMLEGGQDD